ncbi:unnamed protein product [Didymodactylos carnosus]|uniref:Uncharacterized protein n=1 Tax=Didymodactylos carnosus TaxID=1234261 RepID=A0A814ZBK5_9BILA|nr:unnamed protein product [Didymodactylos carnosus]CAF1240658.1 unnamed protein product [Didymodactylos carnosus]CAF3854208.1 unnamed protein product [Didymodactylos carnosus]CAF4003409.1 unnamed protein product [Didymodactylos carnosus]
MSSVRSQVIQLPSSNDQVLIINPDGTVVQESNQVYYKKPNAFKRAYEKYKKPKNHYIIEQEGLSYRYCECCHRWCTRRCPACDFCDRIFACPLYFCVIAGLLLLGLLIALLTLFGLLPG